MNAIGGECLGNRYEGSYIDNNYACLKDNGTAVPHCGGEVCF